MSNNSIYDNGIEGMWGGHGVILSSGSGNLAFNNLIWGNFIGIDLAYGASDAKVFNNVVYANDDYGINISSESFNALSGTTSSTRTGAWHYQMGVTERYKTTILWRQIRYLWMPRRTIFTSNRAALPLILELHWPRYRMILTGPLGREVQGMTSGLSKLGVIMPTPTPEPSPTSPPPSPTITLIPAETVPPTLEPTEQPEDLPTTAPTTTPTNIAHYTNTPSPSDTTQSSATHTGMATGTLIPTSTHAATTPDSVGTTGAITPSNSTTRVPISISTPFPTDKGMPTETSAMKPTDTSLQSGAIAPTPMGNIFSRAGLGARILIENIWALIEGLSELLLDEVESSISNH